jgi:hypothetical protein
MDGRSGVKRWDVVIQQIEKQRSNSSYTHTYTYYILIYIYIYHIHIYVFIYSIPLRSFKNGQILIISQLCPAAPVSGHLDDLGGQG